MRISIRSGPALLDELRNDSIEAFFFTDTQVILVPEIAVEPVGEIRPACAVRRDHPLLLRSRLTIDDLGEFPWASSVDPPALADRLSSRRLICDMRGRVMSPLAVSALRKSPRYWREERTLSTEGVEA